MAKLISPKPAQKVHSDPRVSANKLAEYLVASPARRQALVKEQKYPSTFMTIWYKESADLITNFLVEQSQDVEPIIQAIDAMHASITKKGVDKIKTESNIEALSCFLDSYEYLELDGMKPVKCDNKIPKATINGVEVSVRPDILLHGKARGKAACGAIKLYFSKNKPLNDDNGLHISALIHEYLAGQMKVSPSREHCQLYDVFGKAVFAAPTSTKMRMRDIEAACIEIKALWGIM